MKSTAHWQRTLRSARSAAVRGRAWLVPGLLAFVLGGCVTHYYPAPPEVVYERAADSAGTVYHVPSEPTWSEPSVSYVVTSRYYPWWSLDYFYLGYGGGCCGLSVGIGWGYPWYGSWYGPWYRPWYRPWYAWYDPWYWPPYHPGWYAPHYPRHGHHPHRGYAHDAYWRHKWHEEGPAPRREMVDGRYRLPGDEAVAHHPSERRDRIGTRPPRDFEDRKAGPWAEPGSAPVVSSVTPALGSGEEASATTVRNRGGAKVSGYRDLHPWERSGTDGTTVRRVIPADGAAAGTPDLQVVSRTPAEGSAATVRSRAGAKVAPVRLQPVEAPGGGAAPVRALPGPSAGVPTERVKAVPRAAPAMPRTQASVSVLKPSATKSARTPPSLPASGTVRSAPAPSPRTKAAAPPKRSAPVYRAPSRASAPSRVSAPRAPSSRGAPGRRASVRGPGRDADGR